MIGGLTLVFKRVETLADLLMMPVFIAGGVFVPLSQMPGWLAAVGRLFPVTQPLESLRSVLLERQPFDVLWGDGGLFWVAVTSLSWLAFGIASFKLGERLAKRRGNLSHL